MSSEHRNQVGYQMVRDGIATVAEVADLLGTSRQRVDHWCRHGFNPGRYQYSDKARAASVRPDPFDAKATRKRWLTDE